jgi:hypothetical protein
MQRRVINQNFQVMISLEIQDVHAVCILSVLKPALAGIGRGPLSRIVNP